MCKSCQNYRFIIKNNKHVHCKKCNNHNQFKLKEIWVCLGCGQPEPCKSDCPAGRGKSLVRQD